MQELHSATVKLRCAHQRFENAASFITRKSTAFHEIPSAVITLQDSARRRMASKTNKSISTAVKSFLTIRVQADVHTYCTTSQVFQSIADGIAAHKQAAKQAILKKNNSVLAVCMAAKLTKVTLQGVMKRRAARRLAAAAAVAQCMDCVNAFSKCKETFQSTIYCSSKEQQATGRSICLTNSRMLQQTFITTFRFWEHALLQATSTHCKKACVCAAKESFQSHQQSQDVYHAKCQDMLASSNLEAQNARAACIDASNERHNMHSSLATVFSQFNSVTGGNTACHDLPSTTHINFAHQSRDRSATSALQQGARKAGAQTRAQTAVNTESDLMKLLVTAIQRRMPVPEQSTAEHPFQATFGRATAPAAHLTRPASSLARPSAGITSVPPTSNRVPKAGGLHASEHLHTYDHMQQALDEEASDLSHRLRDLAGTMRARAKSRTAVPQSTNRSVSDGAQQDEDA